MTHAQSTDTTDPFSDPRGEASEEVILCSSDNIDLTVPMNILSKASCVLEAMLYVFQLPFCSPDPDPQDVVPGRPPTISLPEDGHTLEILFRFYIHGSDMVVTSLAEVQSVLKAALKYQMQAAVTFLKVRLLELGLIGTNVATAFVIACDLGLTDVTDALFPAFNEWYQIVVLYHYGIGPNKKLEALAQGDSRKEEKEATCGVPSPVIMPLVRRLEEPLLPSGEGQEEEQFLWGLLDTITTDLILKSTDGYSFYVHSSVLSLASPLFAQTIPYQGFTVTEQSTYKLMQVGEDVGVLSKLLRYVYPCPSPPPATLDALEPLLEAAHRLQLQPALTTLRATLSSFIANPDVICISTSLRVCLRARAPPRFQGRAGGGRARPPTRPLRPTGGRVQRARRALPCRPGVGMLRPLHISPPVRRGRLPVRPPARTPAVGDTLGPCPRPGRHSRRFPLG